MTRELRAWALVPTYDNPRTVRDVVLALHRYLDEIVVVDDGSGAAGRRAVEELGGAGLARVARSERNRGKGAAVRTGFEIAARGGATHVLQVDADGQHDLDDVPRFLEVARAQPEALVLGAPVFDDTVPRLRAWARGISTFWVHVETGGAVIADPQCGFRVYPLEAARAAGARGDRMDFDQEIAVRMAWAGTPVVNLPTRVRYVPAEEGGVSHFLLVRDNGRISWLHTRLFLASLWRRLSGAALHGPLPEPATDAPSPRPRSGSLRGRVR